MENAEASAQKSGRWTVENSEAGGSEKSKVASRKCSGLRGQVQRFRVRKSGPWTVEDPEA